MPRIARNQTLVDRTPQETLAEKIKAGKAVPLLSTVVEHDLILGGHEALVKDYAERIAYPLASTNDLPHIAQFRSVTHFSTDVFAMRPEYLNVIKSRLFSIAEDQGGSQDLLVEVDAQFDKLDFTQLAKALEAVVKPCWRLVEGLAKQCSWYHTPTHLMIRWRDQP